MKNIFLIGAGNRAIELFIKPLNIEHYTNTKIIGIYDINLHRAELLSSLSSDYIPVYHSLSEVLRNPNIDIFVILTPDHTHAPLICYLLQHQKAEIMCEKPLCISMEQAETLFHLPDKEKNRIHVLLNSRFMPINMAIKEILSDGIIGKPLFISYHWNIDIPHGTEYFRRWHSDINQSGGMLVHKSCHHFDLMNWWLQDSPKLVSSIGSKNYYVSNTDHGKYCRECSNKCEYRIDLCRQPLIKQMYFDAETEDGYLRDKCIYENVTINDTLCSQIIYERQTVVSYTINFYSYSPSWNINFVGSCGTIYTNFDPKAQSNNIHIQLNTGEQKSIPICTNPLKHSGADLEIRKILFSGNHEMKDTDTFHIGNFTDGLSASLIGILSNCSLTEGRSYANPFLTANQR